MANKKRNASPAVQTIRLLTREEFADAIGVCPVTVRRWEREGRIRMIRFSQNVVRYHPKEIERLAKVFQN
jgi:predicted site-specific integrase-resolvase